MKDSTIVRTPGDILLRDYMIPNDISQGQLAKAIGKSPSTINDIVNGKRSITPEVASLLAVALGTTPELWLGFESAYQLSIIDEDEAKNVRRLTSSEHNDGMYQSGGYTYSGMHYDDAMLGRAVKAVYSALALLNADDQEELAHSMQQYLSYGTIEFPGVYAYNPDMEHMHREVFAIFHMFLMMAGEDREQIKAISREQWTKMVNSVGTCDEDGNPIGNFEEDVD